MLSRHEIFELLDRCSDLADQLEAVSAAADGQGLLVVRRLLDEIDGFEDFVAEFVASGAWQLPLWQAFEKMPRLTESAGFFLSRLNGGYEDHELLGYASPALLDDPTFMHAALSINPALIEHASCVFSTTPALTAQCIELPTAG